MDSAPILAGLDKVTAKWTRQRKAEERSFQSRVRRASMWKVQRVSLKEICHEVMERAYNEASDNGRLPTHWRMVFYRARPLVAEHPEAERDLTDSYFKEVLEEYLELTNSSWDILRGARGSLKEPHADGDQLALSTMGVRNYLALARRELDLGIHHVGTRFPTAGARNRFGAVLICEKEGFDELLQADGLPARYDVALMSTKGISAHAARDLARSLGVRCFTLHDFDKNGFVMAAGFRPFATDIGLRLTDVKELSLADEEQRHRNPPQAYSNLLKNGATAAEAKFIAKGQRVELNELTGPRFIEFVERKLNEQGVTKVVPDQETLASAWRRARLQHRVNAEIDRLAEADDTESVPEDLETQIRAGLDAEPDLPWDEVMARLTEPDGQDD